MRKKIIMVLAASCLTLVFVAGQPSKAQCSQQKLYSGSGFIFAETMYKTSNTSNTSINLYSGCGYLSSKILY